ncbi:MAG TPA: DUF6580 family putative transport protein [Oleiagrimonas sp.]|nr:DUF6580 family putative transport protein [Oleiagrimonas sp.]
MRPMQPATSHTFNPRLLVLIGMIAFAVVFRLVTYFNPGALPYNFTPVAAIALFGGAYFAHRGLAVLVPLLAMLCADVAIAFALPSAQLGHWLAMAPVIYVCVAAIAVGAFALRSKVRVVNVILAAAGSATGFYLVTNFFVWLMSGMYAMTASGLAACYVAALPFYIQGSLLGTMVWSGVLFGAFALLSRRYPALRMTPAAA